MSWSWQNPITVNRELIFWFPITCCVPTSIGEHCPPPKLPHLTCCVTGYPECHDSRRPSVFKAPSHSKTPRKLSNPSNWCLGTCTLWISRSNQVDFYFGMFWPFNSIALPWCGREYIKERLFSIQYNWRTPRKEENRMEKNLAGPSSRIERRKEKNTRK